MANRDSHTVRGDGQRDRETERERVTERKAKRDRVTEREKGLETE